MSNFLKALAKVGLVELDSSSSPSGSKSSLDAFSTPEGEDEIERILRETQAALAASDSAASPAPVSPAAPAPSAASAAAPRAVPAGSLSAENSLDAIYMAAGVPDSPFPVEKLLKMLDGLKALPMASRQAAVVALDAADENWSIADVILDAQRKTRALREEQARLDSHIAATDGQAQADIAAAESYLEQATATIREQIAELETLLQQEVQQIAEKKSQITLSLQSDRDSVVRQRGRLDEEIERIARIPQTFGDYAS